jgi:pimeloyl-ACP methyl ester carboxylesterase
MPKDVVLKIDPSLLSGMTVLHLIDMIGKYPLVTRKMLLIVPNRGTDHLETVMNAAADKMKVEAVAKLWSVIDLRGNGASKAAILNALRKEKPDFVAYFGHSYGSNIPGQSNNQFHVAISSANANVLSGLTACITACTTINSVGIPATQAKCVAYMGYTDLYTMVIATLVADGSLYLAYPPTQDYIKATNAVYLALLDGSTFKDAKEVGRKAWDDVWKIWAVKRQSDPSIDPFIAADALTNRDRLDFVGTPSAVARPIGLLVTN